MIMPSKAADETEVSEATPDGEKEARTRSENGKEGRALDEFGRVPGTALRPPTTTQEPSPQREIAP